MRLLFSVCFVLSTGLVSVAAADVKLPELPAANSGPAKSLVRDMPGFADRIARECVANDPAAYEESFRRREADIAKFTDANEKAAWAKYLVELRAIYKARLDGLPGAGTFAEIRAKHQQAKVDIDAKLPVAKELPADVTQAKQLVAEINAYTAFLDGVLATYEAVLDSRCDEKLTANWWPLKNDADAGKQQARSLLRGLVYNDAAMIHQWVGGLAQGTQEPAADWWHHIRYASRVLQQVGKAQRFVGKLDVLLELAPASLNASDAAMLETDAPVVRDYMAKNVPLLRKLIGEILLPRAAGSAKQVADFKKYMKGFDTGVIVGSPVARKVTISTYDEWDGGRKYSVVKKFYTNYYVWKAKKPSEGMPTIDGISPDQICEMWSRNLVSYDKGGPRHAPLKQWRGDQDNFQGFMLCANSTKKSPLPDKN